MPPHRQRRGKWRGRGREAGWTGATAAALLAAATLAVFARTLGYQFLNFDDTLYVTANPDVTAGLSARGLRWALTSTRASNWHPLTWLSHQLDVSLFGLQPWGHHLR
jgi:protein O-mannosyl-transferase